MSHSLRVFVMTCGLIPLAMVTYNFSEISRIDPSAVLPTVLLSAFSLLALTCFGVLYGPMLRTRRLSLRPRRSTA